MAHVELEEIVASLGIVLKLLPIDIYVIHLGLLDEMHKLDLRIRELLLLIRLQLLVDQILVAVVHLFTFKTHLLFSSLLIKFDKIAELSSN